MEKLNDVEKVPYITKEQEKRLFIAYYNSDDEAKDIIINANLNYVIKKAHENDVGGMFSELVESGKRALNDAFEEFDSTRDIRFINFAKHKVSHYMKETLEKKLANLNKGDNYERGRNIK